MSTKQHEKPLFIEWFFYCAIINPMSKKTARTLFRSDETMTKYIEMIERRNLEQDKINHFLHYEEGVLVKEFKNWVILENKFPYDRVATVNHIIVTKREVVSDWSLLTQEEREEFEKIKADYLMNKYDALLENFPSAQTMPGHFHLHLLILKREVK